MALKIKPGVELKESYAGIAIIQALKAVSKQLGMDLTITSGMDGIHSGPDDPHHFGNAYDVRSHDIEPVNRPRVLYLIMAQLGETFYGFLEDAGGTNEHFHIQLRKGTTFDLEHYIDN